MTSFFSLNVNDVFDNVLHSCFFSQYKKKKNFKQIIKMNEKLFKEQKHDIIY